MKKIITTLVLALLTASFTYAIESAPDSMYVHFTASDASDSIVAHAIADVDSIVYYAPVISEPQGIDWSSVTEGVVQPNALTDADEKSYSAVKIGTQVWMAENLQSASGTYIEDNDTWGDLDASDTDAAYCYYNNDADGEKATYGALYTYAAALNACPSGWHLPSDAEWKTLEMFLGMSQTDADDTAWRGTNEGSQLAGNSDLWSRGPLVEHSEFGTSGFFGLPGGLRNSYGGSFSNKGAAGYWWSSTDYTIGYGFHRYLSYYMWEVAGGGSVKSDGFSVRCVRD